MSASTAVRPPERVLVLCVDEKSQIQALNHTQPLLPLRPGQVEWYTHDHKRCGMTLLSAALIRISICTSQIAPGIAGSMPPPTVAGPGEGIHHHRC